VVFRYDGKISAVSNVCQHQTGPLREGRIVDGCITCPWHGYQYLPDSGASTAPFIEKIPTFRAKVVGTKVLIHPCPIHPEHAWSRPVSQCLLEFIMSEFYIGYLPKAPQGLG
jgi:hypothetical protein